MVHLECMDSAYVPALRRAVFLWFRAVSGNHGVRKGRGRLRTNWNCVQTVAMPATGRLQKKEVISRCKRRPGADICRKLVV